MFRAIWRLLLFYTKRSDLQKAFPEVKDGNLKGLLNWAAYSSQNLFDDNEAFEFLKDNAEFYYHASKFENFVPYKEFSNLPKEFFILGAGRSGTTLLKRIFNCHSLTAGIEEGRTYQSITNPFLLRLQKIFESNKQWIGLKGPAITDCLLSDDFVAFPVPGFDDKLAENFRKFYSDQPIIFLTRDVRDRVSSVINLGGRTGVGIDGLNNTFRAWIKKNPYIQENFNEEIKNVERSKEKIFAFEALDWKIKNSSYFIYKERGYPILRIKYEDLVLKTEESLQQITKFLQLPFEKTMLNFYKMPHPGLKSIGVDSNLDKTQRNTDSKSIGLYKKHLNENQTTAIMDITSDLMKELGY